jgi:hypothetical protein
VSTEDIATVAEELVIGPERPGRSAQWLSAGAALIAGLLVGHLSTGTSLSPSSRSSASTPPAQQTATINRAGGQVRGASSRSGPAGCPPFRTCIARHVSSTRVVRVLNGEFHDLSSERIVATDDTSTPDRYRLRLVATLARGLTIDISVDNTATPSATVTPWIFLSTDPDHRAAYATRTMIDGAPNGPTVQITIARGYRPPLPETRCRSCRRVIERSEAAVRLQGLSGVTRNQMISALAVGVYAADNQRVLDSFKIGKEGA